MKQFTPLRRRDDCAWNAFIDERTAEIHREYRRGNIEAIILGLVVFLSGAYLLCEPMAYFLARFCK